VLESIEALADFLVSEARTIEKGSESAKRAAKEEVPGDRVKDAPALARELRWRVRAAAGWGSDDEGRGKRKGGSASHVNGNGKETHAANGAGKKRKRAEEEVQTHDIEEPARAVFMHFQPRRWDAVVAYPMEREEREVKRTRPPHTVDGNSEEKGMEGWLAAWTGKEDGDVEMEGEEAKVETRRDVVVKVRRTAKGVERQRVERVLEEWTWETGEKSTILDDSSSHVAPPAEAVTNSNGSHSESEPVKDPPPPETTEDGEPKDVEMAAAPAQ
jgi:hypothetical protein